MAKNVNAQKYTAQEVLNLVFDEDTRTLDTGGSGGGGGSVTIEETSPVDATKLNASYVLSYNANGDLVRVDKIVGATTYRKDIDPINHDTVIVDSVTYGSWTTV